MSELNKTARDILGEYTKPPENWGDLGILAQRLIDAGYRAGLERGAAVAGSMAEGASEPAFSHYLAVERAIRAEAEKVRNGK